MVILSRWVLGILGGGAFATLIFLSPKSVMLWQGVENFSYLSFLSATRPDISAKSTISLVFPTTTYIAGPDTTSFLEENPVVFSEFVASSSEFETHTEESGSIFIVSSSSDVVFASSSDVEIVSSTTVVSDFGIVHVPNIVSGTSYPVFVGASPISCVFTSSTPSRIARINEIAWMGTINNYADEWVELYNTSSSSLNLANFQLVASSSKSSFAIHFDDKDIISPQGYFLLERANDYTVPNISADKIYTGALKDSDEVIQLFDASCDLLDRVDFRSDFPEISKNVDRRSMEREADGLFSLYEGGADDVSGIFGTPKRGNSVFISVSSVESSVEVLNVSSGTSINFATSSDGVAADIIASSTFVVDDVEALVMSVVEPSSSSSDVMTATSTVSVQEVSSSNDIFYSSSTESLALSYVATSTPYSNIIINEVLFNAEGSDKGKEFIELHNLLDAGMNLDGWALRIIKTDATSSVSLATFGDNVNDVVVIPQHGFLLVGFNGYDSVNFNKITADIRRSSALPNGEDEVSVLLLSADKSEIDQVTYSARSVEKEGQSLMRNGAGFVIQDAPTPQSSQMR